jgi:hypothetical protein
MIHMISYRDKNGDFTMGIWDVKMGIEAYSNNNMGRGNGQMVLWDSANAITNGLPW